MYCTVFVPSSSGSSPIYMVKALKVIEPAFASGNGMCICNRRPCRTGCRFALYFKHSRRYEEVLATFMGGICEEVEVAVLEKR